MANKYFKNLATKEMQIINILRIHLISIRTSINKNKTLASMWEKRNSALPVGGSVS